MASAQFLEEVLSTDVDESAVTALVGSLETQLVPTPHNHVDPPLKIVTYSTNSLNLNNKVIFTQSNGSVPVTSVGVIKVEPGRQSMTAGSMTLTPGTSTASVVTLAKPMMAGQPVGNTVQILNVNPVRPGTPTQGQKGMPQQRLVLNSPQVITRPGAPGQPTQITLQALQGLQPGGGGHILVKTESGQLQLIRVGPAPNATGQQMAPNSTTQFRMQVPVAGSTVVVSASNANVAPSNPPSLTVTTPAQRQQVDTTKEKCRKFLANLLELSSREPKAVERNVRTLIQELIDAKVEPEEFCDRLEKLLNASPQPCLIGFLKKSLPLLRQSLFVREMTIEGIRPPPQNVIVNTSLAQVSQPRPQMVTQTVRVVAPLNAAGQSLNVTTPRGGAPLQHRLVAPIRGLTTQNKMLTTSIRGQTPIATSTQPPPLHHTTPISSPTFRAGAPKLISNKMPAKTAIQNKVNANNFRTSNIVNKNTPIVVNKSLSRVVARVGDDKFSGGFGGDDDINDVAAMGGVNLAEESQRILGSTEFVGTQIRSIKDEMFLHSIPLQNKIRQIVERHGLEEPSPDVTAMISHACQDRLKTLLEKLACIAEHRIDVIKLDPRYEVSQDVKGQLKFLEELDKVERKKHEEQERELLLRAAKSRSKSEDPEQVKLKAKAKEMQRAEMEELRQREANLTALQAIGPRKKPRIDGPSGVADNMSASTFNRPGMPLRPRLKRVNLKDLLFLLEQEKDTSRTHLLYKSYLK